MRTHLPLTDICIKMTQTVADKVPFHQFAVLLERILVLSGTDAKKRLLKDFLDEWRAFDAKLHAGDTAQTVNDTFFPAMRLLLPQLDRDREAYGIKEHTLAKLYIELLGLGKDGPAAQKLLNYRAPKNAKGDAGDFASVAFWVLKPRCAERGTLSVAEINACLDGVAAANARKDRAGVRTHLLHALRNTSAKEQKWLIRIIMKELKMGLSQQSVLGVFHEDAEDLYNVKMSLDKVCSMLKDPATRLHEIEISLFSPFRPMLGDRAAPNKIEQLLKNRPFFIETKFDGERMQLHKSADQYKFFSRSGNEYTHVYGADRWSGNFTPHIAACFKPGIQSCILDGEMVGFNPDTKTIGSKGENFDIKAQVAGSYQPMLCVFDILELNGRVLSNQPLRERRRALANLLTPIEGRIMLSEFIEKRTCQDCGEALNEAIDRREEGIMVKDPEGPYRPNARKGGWYKLKPEYVAGLMDELDLIVVGGFFGVGARSHMMSHFLCAVAVPTVAKGGGGGVAREAVAMEGGVDTGVGGQRKNDDSTGDAAGEGGSEEDRPSKFYSFCKVGSGYSHTELHEFNRRLANDWTVFDKKNAPDWLELAPGFKQRPDAYIHPSKSAILQIKAAEIVDSDQYRTGCTLRFPRVEKIRADKAWYDCMTIGELEDLRTKSAGKLTNQYVDPSGEGEDGEPSRKKAARTNFVKPSVAARFRGIDASAVKKVSEVFQSRELCVVSGSTELSKADAERLIIELGGTIVQNPAESTYCVLADKVNIRVRNLISKGAYDVVKLAWLQRCADQRTLLDWIPAEMLHSSSRALAHFAADYDPHGDGYYDDTTPTELRAIFERMGSGSNKVPLVTSTDIAELEAKYFPHDSAASGLFRLCGVYLDSCVCVGDPSTRVGSASLDLIGQELRLGGAELSDRITEGVSHVIVDPRDTSRMDLLRYHNRSRGKLFHIVDPSWARDSIAAGKLLPERHYEPK